MDYYLGSSYQEIFIFLRKYFTWNIMYIKFYFVQIFILKFQTCYYTLNTYSVFH